MKKRPARILIDFTKSYDGKHMGIRRVVLNIVKRSQALEEKSGTPCFPVIARRSSFQRVSLREIPHFESSKKSSGRSLWKKGLASLVNKKIFAVLGDLSFLYRKRRILPSPDDLLLLPDAFWGQDPTYIDSFFLAKEAGAKIILVVHDLIPYDYPNLYEEKFLKNYLECLFRIVPLLDGILTVSQVVKDDVRRFLNCEFGSKFQDLPVDHFMLGADSKEVSYCSSEIRQDVEDLAARKPFLAVGTIEARKDPLTLIEAFDRLALKDPTIHLLFVGKIGFRGNEILSRARLSPFFGERLIVRHDIEDYELSLLYRSARGLVFSSLAEGFGLPLVEAMRMGIPIICSDISIFREVGRDYPVFFRAGDSQDLEKALRKVLTLSESSVAPAYVPVVSWDEAAFEFLQKALLLYNSVSDS